MIKLRCAVYTRKSLLDLTRLVEASDKAGVSLVSTAQLFNTTTSMGRLTLNMLLPHGRELQGRAPGNHRP